MKADKRDDLMAVRSLYSGHQYIDIRDDMKAICALISGHHISAVLTVLLIP